MKREDAILQDMEQIEYGSHGGAAFFLICIKALSEYLEDDREALQRTVSALGRWMEHFYAKSARAYDTWYEMLLDDSRFASTANEGMFSGLLVQKDIIQSLIEDRNQEAAYLLELAEKLRKRGRQQSGQLQQAARHFQKVSAYAEEFRYLIGDWPDMDAMLRHLEDRKVREELAKLILYVKAEDEAALQCLKAYLQ